MTRVMPLMVAALAGLGVLASSSLAGSRSTAGCTPHNSIGASSFDYVLCGLPDIDQIREHTATTPGLPGDGYAYCVPTATMDALAYFASHGIPALRPGNKDWAAPANYNEMTTDINDLGNLMGTTAGGGTTDGAFAGLDAWLSQTQPGVIPPALVASHLWVTTPDQSVYFPDLQSMANAAAAGSVVIVNVAFMNYEKPPAPATGPKQWFNIGGHDLAMSSAKSPSTIGLHDPANPLADHASQSPYAEEKYALTPVTSTFGYLDDHGMDVNFSATLQRVDSYFIDSVLPAGSQTFVWGYTTLSPETVTGFVARKITLVAAVKPGDPVESFFAAGEKPVVDLALDPARPRDFYVTEGSSTIWQLNTASGRSTPFAHASSPPELLGYAGRTRTLFAVERKSLTALSGQRESKNTLAAVPLSEHVDAVTVDQVTSRLLALSAESGRLRVYDSHLRLLGTVQLPSAALAGTGKVSITLRGRVLYAHRDGRPALGLFMLRGSKLAGARFVRLAGAVRPQGLAVDDAGNVFVQSDGKLAEFAPSGKLVGKSQFNGKVAGSQLRVNRRFSNADFSALPFRDTPLPRPRKRG
jgi:hypothetical protein